MFSSEKKPDLDIDLLFDEYLSSIDTMSFKNNASELDHDALIAMLMKNHDWTEKGADVICTLATQYGSFMLRNALALSLALRIEDGDLDF